MLPRLLAGVRGTLAPAGAARGHTYGEIVRSTALIGAASVLNIVIGIVRTKAIALLLGPAGVGLLGVFSSIADLARSFAELGINSSGVRQIAEAAGSSDGGRIARTAAVLRRTAIALGVLGAAVLAAACVPVSMLTFGNAGHAGEVALLSLVVLFKLVADGHAALLQGMRRIRDLARAGVVGALLGTLLTIPLVYFLGDRGVVPSLVAVAASSLAAFWWYSRTPSVTRPVLTVAEVRNEAAGLLKLGLAFMASGLLMVGSGYVVRLIVLHDVGLEAAGLYQAAWTLGGLYVGLILQAMGADFYPRLVGAAEDHATCNRLVNEQARVGLLLVVPGVIATVTFAPLVLTLLYSAEFTHAVEVLRWICLGMALRVITWPMGFIVIAQGRRTMFFVTELLWTVVSVALAWTCVGAFGLAGAGIAFFGAYVFHGLMMYVVVRVLSGFGWSEDNLRGGAAALAVIGLAFGAFHALPATFATALGALATIATTAWSVRSLFVLVAEGKAPGLGPMATKYLTRRSGRT
jgi:PST family polysaccharide transporter